MCGESFKAIKSCLDTKMVYGGPFLSSIRIYKYVTVSALLLVFSTELVGVEL